MSYLKKIEYKIVLNDSFPIIRSCSKCGTKTHFTNTKKFRVNANGNKLDIWLIYQCEKCKQTLNLAVYERQKVCSITKEEYQDFLENNEQLAEKYGRNLQLFRKNKVEIDFERLDYDYVKLHETMQYNDSEELTVIEIHNPYQMKIRPEKQLAEVLGLSRIRVKRLLEEGEIELKVNLPQYISVYVKKRQKKGNA